MALNFAQLGVKAANGYNTFSKAEQLDAIADDLNVLLGHLGKVGLKSINETFWNIGWTAATATQKDTYRPHHEFVCNIFHRGENVSESSIRSELQRRVVKHVSSEIVDEGCACVVQ